MGDEERRLFQMEQGSRAYACRMKLVNTILEGIQAEQDRLSATAGISVGSLLEQYRLHGKAAVSVAIQAHGPDFLNYLGRSSEAVDWTVRREKYEDRLEVSLRESFEKLDQKEAPEE